MSWKPWFFFHSPTAKTICANMNAHEFNALITDFIMNITWNAIALTIIAMVLQTPFTFAMYLSLYLIILLIINQFAFTKQLKEFLCSTEWAKAQGYKPETLKLFSLQFFSQKG